MGCSMLLEKAVFWPTFTEDVMSSSTAPPSYVFWVEGAYASLAHRVVIMTTVMKVKMISFT